MAPYLIYQLLYLPLQVFSNLRHMGSDDTILLMIAKQLCGILLGDGYSTPVSYYSCLPCWFIVSIFQLRLLFSYMKINKVSSLLLIIAAILFLYIRKMYGFDLFACIDSTIMAIPYYLLGFWLRNSKPSNNIVRFLIGGDSKTFKCLTFGVLICLVYKYNGAAQMNGPSVGNDVVINYIGGIAGSLLVFNISMLFSKLPDYIKLISRNTLFIIFFHWCCLMFVRELMFVTSFLIVHFVEAVIFAILILIASYFAILRLGKYCPVMLGKYQPVKFEK